MKPHVTLLLALGAATACNSDIDGDGLDVSIERDLGTDPKVADSDGDGLQDADEVDLGLDALDPDSDGDGMSDGDEVKYGFDPLDEKSDGYKGGWPMQEVAVKDAIAAQGKAGTESTMGQRFKRLRFKDQFNDEVDLYDFAGHGKRVVVEVSAEWCPPCNMMSDWLSGAYTEEDFVGGGYSEEEARMIFSVLEQVQSGDLLWLTVLGQDNYGDPPDRDVIRSWHEKYPAEKVPLLQETGTVTVDYVIKPLGSAWPTMVALNENMKVVADTSGSSVVFDPAFFGELAR